MEIYAIYKKYYSTDLPKSQGGSYMKNCNKCGKLLPDDGIFCPYCGKRQGGQKQKQTRRGNGLGSVYKASSGSWAAEITLGWYMDAGKLRRRRERKQGFRTKKEASEWIAAAMQGKAHLERITVSELHELWKASQEGKLGKTKVAAYAIAWKKIRDAVAHRYIDELTVPELQELTDEAGTSYYTKRDIKTLLSHLYKIALRDDYAEKNRAQYIQLPTLETQERAVFTEQEIDRLWRYYAATADLTACRMLIMIYTGIRPGELMTIRTENIHLEEQWMTGGIKTEKGRKRKIIIPDCIVPLILRSIDGSSGGLLAKYGKNVLYDHWNALRNELGLREELSPYCCRHTYITRLTALKVSPAMLQELAGHEDYDTTLDYTHLSVKERLIEVNRLAHSA